MICLLLPTILIIVLTLCIGLLPFLHDGLRGAEHPERVDVCLLYVQINTNKYVYVTIYTNIHTCIDNVYVYIYIYIYISLSLYIHIYIYTYIYIHVTYEVVSIQSESVAGAPAHFLCYNAEDPLLYIYRYTYIHIDRQIQTQIYTYIDTHRQIDRQTDRQRP